MTNDELAFMIAACDASESQHNGSLCVGNVDPILSALSQKGLTEKQVWRCQFSLRRIGYIRLHGNYDVDDVDPDWSKAAPVFTITPAGLRWWLVRQYGQAGYSKMVADIRRTRDECLKKDIMSVADWANRLDLDLLLVQKVIHAEVIM